jgi:hypothetical protein
MTTIQLPADITSYTFAQLEAFVDAYTEAGNRVVPMMNALSEAGVNYVAMSKAAKAQAQADVLANEQAEYEARLTEQLEALAAKAIIAPVIINWSFGTAYTPMTDNFSFWLKTQAENKGQVTVNGQTIFLQANIERTSGYIKAFAA